MRLALLFVWLALPSEAAAQSVEDQIRSEVSRHVRTVNQSDAAALAALYLADAHTSSIGDGRLYQGWQSLPVERRRGRCD